MTEVDSYSVLLRQLWAKTWDAARFSAERPLRKPAFQLSACGVQLELASQAVARVREAIGTDVEVMNLLPLEGRSCYLLERMVDGGKGLPSPLEDPVGFVEALVHAALQTGDGTYGFGLQTKAAVDALIARHCEDLLNAARGLQDPEVAWRDLESAAAELSAAVHTAFAQDLRAARRGAAVAFSSQVIQLSREMRKLAQRMHEVATPKGGEEESAGEAETTEPESSAPASAPAFGEDQGEDDPMGTNEEETDESEGQGRLQRTKSQVVKRIKVDEVAQTLEARREPILRLRKALSQLDGGEAKTQSSDRSATARFEQTSNELKQVQKLQQSFRNFGEDLMEGVLSLDQISGLADQDRQARKDTLKGLQALLDEIDTAKPRIAKMQKKLAAELDELKPVLAEEKLHEQQQHERQLPQQQQPPQHQQPHIPQQESTRGSAPPLTVPRVDWARLKLPVKFSSVERPRAYILSASLAGLDPDSIRLSRRGGGVLRVQGVRPASEREQKAMLGLLKEHIERMPWKQRQRLTQEDADEMLLQLGHGRCGLFQQEFELPSDVDWEAVEPSYEDGVLRIVLPRMAPPSRGRPGGWLQGMPDSYYRGPSDFLW